MFDRVFSQSSGRVVAVARLALAAVSLIAAIIAPSVPQFADIRYVLVPYLVFSTIILWLVWNDWWIDARIAVPAHIVDMTFFMIVLLWPEGYVSPYFVFFVFLLLSAAIRWEWRATLASAAVLISLYLIAGFLAERTAVAPFELQRFVARSGYLVVLSFILVWFGLRRRFSTGPILADELGESESESDSPFEAAFRHGRRVLKARSGLALWIYPDREQETFGVHGDDPFQPSLPRASPISLPRNPFLFSIAKDRAILAFETTQPRFLAASALVDSRVLELVESDQGLAIPVHTQLGQGLFLYGSIDALHSDHLELGALLSAQLAQSIEHKALISARQEGAIARERMSIARDLHDGIVQFLAGSTYRIEAISRSVADRDDVAANLQDLKELLLLEQEDLRTSIAALRTDRISLTQAAAEAQALCGRLARHWQIDCEFEANSKDAMIAARLHLDILQTIREAVANAARHASARNIAIRLNGENDQIELTVADDGQSSKDGPETGPWSIRERVEEAGGTISMSSGNDGTRLRVRFPVAKER